MTALLTDNLPLLAGAPNGIKKLRELILELAVRGKLVPQDLNDEPASELLKRIAEEKARLVAQGKIKKQKDLTDAPELVARFPLPAGWAATSIGEATICRDGERVPVSQAEREGRKKIFDYYGASGVIDKIDDYLFDKPLLLVGEDGANLINRSTPIAFMARGRYWVNNHAHVLDGINEELLLYIDLYFNAIDLKPYVTGTAQPKMNQSKMNGIPIALPPAAEQKRIITKVDELMALCDRLEAQQGDAENAHAQLVQALLDSLTQASDASEFADNWQRLAEHFHTLFTTEPSIDALKQTLLQLAVMGKLVPQYPCDEPAENLVKRIKAEKQRYLSESKARKQKALATDARQEPPFETPESWEWQTVDDVLHVTGGVTLGRKLGSRKLLSKPYLRVANVQRGHLELEHIKEVEVPEDELEKYLLQSGDLLITEGGDWDKVGRTATWRDELPECLHQNHVFRARAVVSDWEPRWAEMYLNSAPAREYFAGSSKQTTNLASINMTQLRACAFPLPPLAEQHRIVAKIDQLMALCEQLKTRLTEARQLNEQLASTLVERALADERSQAPAAPDRKVARTVLAAEITHQLHGQRTFGQRKLQKVVYLAEHAARLAAIQGDYLRDAAGPHDRQLMNQVESELRNRQWYECIDRETVGHAYRPLSQAGQHRADYQGIWSATERATIEQVIELMRGWDTDRCEMTVTLYAAWNDLILEGRTVSDEAILAEVLHNWNDTKLRFSKAKWLEVLAGMRQHELLTPSGFGRRTTGGMRTLPGFE